MMNIGRTLASAAFAAALSLQGQPPRPVNQFAIGDLVADRSHGNQIVEVAGGVSGDGGYAVLIPGAGAVPVALHSLKLKARVDAPATCPFGAGDVVEFTFLNVRDRGMVMRAIGGYCRVKTSSSEQFEESARLRLVRKGAAKETPPGAGRFTAGQTVQVRSGGYWIPAVVSAFDVDTAWYTVQFPNAAAMMIPPRAYASAAVMRLPQR